MKKSKSPKAPEAMKTVETLEDQLTPAQKETWNNVKHGFIELKMTDEGKLKFRPVQELLDEI